MLIWCAVLLALGILAFVDSLVSMGEIFRKVNSVVFMLISLGLLIRTTTKMKQQKFENYEKRIFSLEQEVNTLKQGQKKLAEY
ncbi:MAG TPA: hypothetical protein VMY05_06695 [Acidobacteriota bacterium]|nr:hypothetical protein [Acidobacteriota bacterium]